MLYQYRIRLELKVKQWYIAEESLGGFLWQGIEKVKCEVLGNAAPNGRFQYQYRMKEIKD